MRRVAASLATTGVACAAYGVYLIANQQFALGSAPLFIGGALLIAALAYAVRAYGFFFGWTYPAAIASGWFGTTTLFEIVHEFQKLGTYDTTRSCLDELLPVIGVPLLWAVCFAGAAIGTAIVRSGQHPLDDRAVLRNMIGPLVVLLLATITSAVAWSPWIRGGSCF